MRSYLADYEHSYLLLFKLANSSYDRICITSFATLGLLILIRHNVYIYLNSDILGLWHCIYCVEHLCTFLFLFFFFFFFCYSSCPAMWALSVFQPISSSNTYCLLSFCCCCCFTPSSCNFIYPILHVLLVSLVFLFPVFSLP